MSRSINNYEHEQGDFLPITSILDEASKIRNGNLNKNVAGLVLQ